MARVSDLPSSPLPPQVGRAEHAAIASEVQRSVVQRVAEHVRGNMAGLGDTSGESLSLLD